MRPTRLIFRRGANPLEDSSASHVVGQDEAGTQHLQQKPGMA